MTEKNKHILAPSDGTPGMIYPIFCVSTLTYIPGFIQIHSGFEEL